MQQQDLLRRSQKRSSQDRHKRTCCCWSGAYKVLTQEHPRSLPQEAFTQPPVRHGICKTFMQGTLQEEIRRISIRSSLKDLHRIMQRIFQILFYRISKRSSHKDMYKIMQGPLREDTTRISTRSSHKDNRFVRACAVDMHMDMTSQKKHSVREFTRKYAAPQEWDPRFVRAWADEMHIIYIFIYLFIYADMAYVSHSPDLLLQDGCVTAVLTESATCLHPLCHKSPISVKRDRKHS